MFFSLKLLLLLVQLKNSSVLASLLDSIIVTISEDSLEACVTIGKEKYFEAIRENIFENPSSDRHQSGLFKLEGTFNKGYFPSLKTYYLDDELDELDASDITTDKTVNQIQSAVYRAKGVARHGQNKMSKKHFDISNDNTNVYVNIWKLKPFSNMTVGIAPVSRKLNKPLNLKRNFLVSNSECP